MSGRIRAIGRARSVYCFTTSTSHLFDDSVPPDPQGKQQHVVETMNGVDVGTSIPVEVVVRDDFTNETHVQQLT
jgi:hypothetical protein